MIRKRGPKEGGGWQRGPTEGVAGREGAPEGRMAEQVRGGVTVTSAGRWGRVQVGLMTGRGTDNESRG